jgi:hypothetical protein
LNVQNIPCGYLLIICETTEECLVNDHCIHFISIDDATPKYAVLSLIVSDAMKHGQVLKFKTTTETFAANLSTPYTV